MLTFNTGSFDPFFNQAFEQYIFDNYRRGDIFYVWQNSAAVIVGQNQNIYREVDSIALERQNIPVVRRMTGGGTVYHDVGNVNYTFISDSDSALSYDRFLNPIINALKKLGINAHKNSVCDIAVDGLKVSGSAQRTCKGRVLHHGTLLFNCDLAKLDLLTAKNKNQSICTKGTLSTVSRVTNISDHLQEKMTVEDFKNYLLGEIAAGAQTVVLNGIQLSEIKALCLDRYKNDQWTYGKTPSFDFEKSGMFEGQPIEVRYSAKKGQIAEGFIVCDGIEGGKADLAGQSIAFVSLKELSLRLCGGDRLLSFII